MAQPKFHDYTEFEDGLLWNASLELLNYMKESLGDDIRNKKIIELGSGLGHLGLGLAGLGADVTLTEHSSVLPSLQDRVSSHVAKHPDIKARALELEWGEEGWEKSSSVIKETQYDIIVTAELLGVVDFHDALLWTLLELAHPNVVIYSVFCDRPWSFMFFAKLADTHQFDVRPVEVKKDDDCDEDAGINMHVITCRR